MVPTLVNLRSKDDESHVGQHALLVRLVCSPVLPVQISMCGCA